MPNGFPGNMSARCRLSYSKIKIDMNRKRRLITSYDQQKHSTTALSRSEPLAMKKPQLIPLQNLLMAGEKQ
jgi:hypothetical protein